MRSEGRRDLWLAGVIWLILVAVGEWLVFSIDLVPRAASAQAEEIDFAFETLFVYAVPVVAFVVVVLVYAVVRWRVSEPGEDGPPIADHRGFSWGWMAVSTGLATLIFFYPGLTGLLALAEEPEPDLVVEVEGVQWSWNLAFPDQGVTIQGAPELVLPVGQTIRFDITSRDVIHSFWVPSFRVKQDAIPGQVKTAYVTTTEEGGFVEDPGMRLQCAELCGTGHARMYIPVRVVPIGEFEAWLAEMNSQGDGMAGMDMGDGEDMGDGMDMDEEG